MSAKLGHPYTAPASSPNSDAFLPIQLSCQQSVPEAQNAPPAVSGFGISVLAYVQPAAASPPASGTELVNLVNESHLPPTHGTENGSNIDESHLPHACGIES